MADGAGADRERSEGNGETMEQAPIESIGAEPIAAALGCYVRVRFSGRGCRGTARC
ncbi:MAG: DUF4129 domain-containing protein [Akkermansiaceae bacterium]|nr:DUF4129 domain-containing protein [Akkermansiaceae bacterium]